MMLLTSTIPCTDSKPEKVRIPVDLSWCDVFNGTDGGFAFAVKNVAAIYDGNRNTYGNGDFWGAGQAVRFVLPEPITLAKVEFDSHAHAGPAWRNTSCTWQGGSLCNDTQQRKVVVADGEWPNVTSFTLTGYARERYYSLKVWRLG